MLHIAHNFIGQRKVGFNQRLDNAKIGFIAPHLHLQAKNGELILRQPFILNDFRAAEKISLEQREPGIPI
jgi:hypothetical protein